MARHKAFVPTEAQLEIVEECLRAGARQAYIAAQLGVSRATISRILRTYFEVTRRPIPKKEIR